MTSAWKILVVLWNLVVVDGAAVGERPQNGDPRPPLPPITAPVLNPFFIPAFFPGLVPPAPCVNPSVPTDDSTPVTESGGPSESTESTSGQPSESTDQSFGQPSSPADIISSTPTANPPAIEYVAIPLVSTRTTNETTNSSQVNETSASKLTQPELMSAIKNSLPPSAVVIQTSEKDKAVLEDQARRLVAAYYALPVYDDAGQLMSYYYKGWTPVAPMTPFRATREPSSTVAPVTLSLGPGLFVARAAPLPGSLPPVRGTTTPSLLLGDRIHLPASTPSSDLLDRPHQVLTPGGVGYAGSFPPTFVPYFLDISQASNGSYPVLWVPAFAYQPGLCQGAVTVTDKTTRSPGQRRRTRSTRSAAYTTSGLEDSTTVTTNSNFVTTAASLDITVV